MVGEKREVPYAVGLDLGTTGARAGLVDFSGTVLNTVAVPYKTATPYPGWAEQDPESWWYASTRAISQLIASSGVEAGSISGVGLSGQMHGSVFLDAERSVIRPCIIWCDQRAAPQCRWITDSVGTERLAEWVSNRALAGFTAPKVLWLRENEPDNYARVRTLLLPKDYMNLRITGNLSTDTSDASGTLLFDVRRRSWSEPMLEALRIPRDWLPPVHESSDIIGEVTAEAAEATGLPAGTPVAAGGADNACGALGMGVITPGDVAVSIGSSGTVLAPVETPAVDREMALHSFCHALPDTWYVMGVMLSAGLSLRWFRDQFGEPERTDALRRGEDPYQLLDETAAEAPPGCEGLVFLPYLNGERTPHADPNARGVLFGLDLTKTRAHVVRSVMEGVVFGLNDSVEIMRRLDIPLERVVAAGGGSRSALWLQMQADIFELPVRATGESNAAMLGAALLGATSGGAFSDIGEACRAAASYGELFRTNTANEAAYHEAYGLFVSLYPALSDLW